MMKQLILSAVAFATFTGYAFQIMHGVVYEYKSAEGTITFELPNEGSKGSVKGLEATFSMSVEHINTAALKASVKVNTLTTGIDMRDKHLMSNDYFDAEKHPLITFTATKIDRTDSGFVALGNLAMRDSVKAIQVPFKITEKEGVSHFIGTIDIFAGDYGVGKKSKKGTDRVVVTVDVPVEKRQ